MLCQEEEVFFCRFWLWRNTWRYWDVAHLWWIGVSISNHLEVQPDLTGWDFFMKVGKRSAFAWGSAMAFALSPSNIRIFFHIWVGSRFLVRWFDTFALFSFKIQILTSIPFDFNGFKTQFNIISRSNSNPCPKDSSRTLYSVIFSSKSHWRQKATQLVIYWNSTVSESLSFNYTSFDVFDDDAGD